MANVGVLNVLLTGDIRSYEKAMNKAAKKARSTQRKLDRIGSDLTRTLTLPILAAGAAAVKFASDYESAFIGVRKTVDATEAEFARLSTGIREMSKQIPSAATEIAKVGEVAGQLGISTKHLLTFSRTMIDLGNTTDMVAPEAAKQLARLANVTQMSERDFGRLGATIVDLGNNLAATESEIVALGMRIAGAGKVVGMAETDILALAGSLASVGVEAQAGGTAMSKAMVKMAEAIESGGDRLKVFAEVSGETTEAFVAHFQRDAAGAIVSFIEGLGRIRAEGGHVFGTLTQLEMGEVRLRDALLRASGAAGIMRGALERARKAWQEDIALTKEAEERYGSFASKMKIVWNRIKDTGITLGESLTPALLDLVDALEPAVEWVGKLAQGFADLDPKLQKTVLGLAALVALAGPMVKLGAAVAGVKAAIATAMPVIVGGLAALVALGVLPAIAAGTAIIVASGLAWKQWGDNIKEAVGKTLGPMKEFTEDVAAMHRELDILFAVEAWREKNREKWADLFTAPDVDTAGWATAKDELSDEMKAFQAEMDRIFAEGPKPGLPGFRDMGTYTEAMDEYREWLQELEGLTPTIHLPKWESGLAKMAKSIGLLREHTQQWGQEWASTIADAIVRGEFFSLRLRDFIQRIAADLAQMMIYAKITGPIFRAVSTALSLPSHGDLPVGEPAGSADILGPPLTFAGAGAAGGISVTIINQGPPLKVGSVSGSGNALEITVASAWKSAYAKGRFDSDFNKGHGIARKGVGR